MLKKLIPILDSLLMMLNLLKYIKAKRYRNGFPTLRANTTDQEKLKLHKKYANRKNTKILLEHFSFSRL